MRQEFIESKVGDLRKKKQENFAALLHRAMKPKSQQVLRIHPHGVYNLPPAFIKTGDTMKGLYSYKIAILDQVINFGKIYEVIDSEEKEWFGKKGGKKPRKGPAKKKAVKGAKDQQEEGIWTDDI